MAEELKLIDKSIQEALSTAFLNYAGYNLQRRSIPDVRDGLKWGGRQLLHAQSLAKLTHDKPFKKAIKSVSQAMGFSYVHGDASAYGTFIRMAKPFVMNVPWQETTGNYGTLIDPQDHSQSRYVEMRGSEAASYLLKDLDKNTIDEWEETYDMEGQFPKVLPAKGIWGLVNGCISIGSGMSCSIPPFNLKELNNSLIKLMWNSDISDDELIILPDFPTGGILLNSEEVKESLKNGNGHACKIRAIIEFDDKERCFIVKEMPYSTYTNTICGELAALMQEDEKSGIKEFVDYTGEKPDIRIYLQKGANPSEVLKKLYKNTSLQTFYSINMTMLDQGKIPRVFGLREAMMAYLKHLYTVYKKGYQFDLDKIEQRLHILIGLMKALDCVDEVIALIRNSNSSKEASLKLQEFLIIDEAQAKAILDIKLARLAKLEITKLKQEQELLETEADKLQQILNNDTLLKTEIQKDFETVIKKFNHPRRTKIENVENEEDEIIEEKTLSISLLNTNSIFVQETSNLYRSNRNTAGAHLKLKSNEYIINTFSFKNTDQIYLFSKTGMYYSLKASQLPLNQICSLYTYLKLSEDDQITQIIGCKSTDQNKYLLFITEQGYGKKTELTNYRTSVNKDGIKAINLMEGDIIKSILIVQDEDIVIATKYGQVMWCGTSDIRPIGRVSRGIKIIKLGENDKTVSAELINDQSKYIASISDKGLIKKTELKEYSKTKSGAKGIKIMKLNADDVLSGMTVLSNSDKEVILVSDTNCLKISTDSIPLSSRMSVGVKSLKLKDNQIIRGICKAN